MRKLLIPLLAALALPTAVNATNYLECEAIYQALNRQSKILMNDLNNEKQKDLSSISIEEINFPKIVYMIVDNKIELEIKILKDYYQWQFLSQKELSRKTIEIYYDLKNAKRFCNKEQKVLKIPNPNVLRITAPILKSRGISRIVCQEQLIAL